MRRFVLMVLLILLAVMIVCIPAQAKPVEYTVELDAAAGVYEGPGEESGYLKRVGADGVYTITEEARDGYGRLWGRLKSGVGWVCLTDARGDMPPVFCGVPYTVELDAWVPVYSEPDCENGVNVSMIGEDGVYTIVDERLDLCGNVWGRLKSGAGWIDLSCVRMAEKPPMTAYFAEVVQLNDDNWCGYIVDNSEYMVKIAFRANEPLNNVELTLLQYGEEGYAIDERFFWGHRLEKDTYLLAGVAFYGDMTTYGISFVDDGGQERFYAVYLSGLNGSVIMEEYIP